MGKLRSHPQGQLISRSRLQELLQNSSKTRRFSSQKQSQSRIFQQTQCQTINSNPSQSQKDHLYNKNINKFRDSFHHSDSQILPFLASLRTIKDYRQVKTPKNSAVSPFEAEKATANQKVRKSVNDIRANPFRLSKASYRWHNGSGANNRNGCEFECSLRLNKKMSEHSNPQSSSFNNTLAPVRLKTLEPARYDPASLICQRQRRLFTLEA